MVISLQVISAADIDGREILTRDHPDFALVWDHGSVDLACGSCGFVPAVRVEGPAVLAGYVLRCPDCESLNAQPSPQT